MPSRDVAFHLGDRPTAPATDKAMWAVPLSDVLVDDEIREAVGDAVTSGWWSMGPRVEELESAFAEFTGARHAIAVANGTAALHLGLLALGCGPGDEVVLPSLNFVAAANAVAHTGARPVFCDIRASADLNLDPEDVEAAIGPATRLVLALHYGGYLCDLDALSDVAGRHDLPIIEDAAHAVGASRRGRMSGTFGRAGCFSFFSNKNLPTGEGGMLVTDDDEVAAEVRLLRSHGMTTLTWARHQGHASSYDVLEPGFNYRLDEVRAAIGLVQLKRLRAANEARARIAERYRRELGGLAGVEIPFTQTGADATSSHHLAVILMADPSQREPLRDHLRERGIQTSVHYPPIHRFSAYANDSHRSLPVTEDVADRLVTLPLFAHMTERQEELVIGGVREFLSRSRQASARAR
jgi:dTDP-4-amino-4,6-dideoxygalactose transaminase